jgi:hypothetical protein
MEQDNSLYVSVDLNSYKASKTNLLKSQALILNLIKHLNNIKNISSEKSSEKIRLYTLFFSMSRNLEKIKKLIPKPHIPKSIREKHETKQEIRAEKRKKQEHELKNKEIDEELKEIQEKLKALNR